MDNLMTGIHFLTLKIAGFNIQIRLKSINRKEARKFAILEDFGKYLIYKEKGRLGSESPFLVKKT